MVPIVTGDKLAGRSALTAMVDTSRWQASARASPPVSGDARGAGSQTRSRERSGTASLSLPDRQSQAIVAYPVGAAGRSRTVGAGLSEPPPTLTVVRDEATTAGAVAGRAPLAGSLAGWPALRGLVRAQQPVLSAPRQGMHGLCVVCHGPSPGLASRCFQCDLHWQCAQDGMADVVVPVAFAVKGGAHAGNLWRYKSARAGQAASASAAALRALLLVFLRDHRACVCRAAGLDRPTHLAVVPTGRGRPGPHPLRALVAPYLTIPWAELAATPGDHGGDLDPRRFVAAPVPGARVLLVDDTWTTGASAQSAAMALRSAGATAVATVVLGRHVGAAGPATGGPGNARSGAALGPAAAPFSQRTCAVHRTG